MNAMVRLFTHLLPVTVILLFSLNSPAASITDQAGYPTQAIKYTYSNQSSDSFFVVNSATGQTVFRGAFELWKNDDPATGMTLYCGDFTSFQAPGEYYIETTDAQRSARFKIDDSVYYNVYYQALRAFYFQRCGTALEKTWAGEYVHGTCHTTDGFLHSSTGQSGYVKTTGGWHDAGDFGKYVVNAGITVGTLLMAYEYFPGNFSQDNLEIPESANGIPDLLDEVRYELEWLLSMQDSSGGVYFKLTREQFSGFVMPGTDKSPRYLYQMSSTATAGFAAMTARGARIYQAFDTEFAARLLDAAKGAWNYLERHPDIVPSGGFHNPDGTNTGEYGDSSDRDERLWAASELFAATGNSIYHSYFLTHYKALGLFSGGMYWGDVRQLGYLTYLETSQPALNIGVQAELKSSLKNYCDGLLIKRDKSGFRVLLQPGEYNWGSNSGALNQAMLLVMGFKELDNFDYLDAAMDQLHYVLGVNAHNMTFVTGIGERSPLHPHHRPSIADGITLPVPGMLVGGADQYLNDDVLKSRFTSSTPPALCYADHQDSYASNEIAINWNAPLVFLAGVLNSPAILGIRPASGEQRPTGFLLEQNYPNPFNAGTTIQYSLASAGQVRIIVFDVLGNEVTTILEAAKPAGTYQVKWQPHSSSGIYFYRMDVIAENTSSSQVRKMLLMK